MSKITNILFKIQFKREINYLKWLFLKQSSTLIIQKATNNGDHKVNKYKNLKGPTKD